MLAWIAYLGFPLGAVCFAIAFAKTDGDYPWYDPERPRALVWGIALFAIALDAAIFGILPVWGD